MEKFKDIKRRISVAEMPTWMPKMTGKKGKGSEKIEPKEKNKLSENQLSEIRRAFESFDTDKSGSIDIDELGPLMRSLGENPKPSELNAMLIEIDENGNGTIEFDEFVDFILSKFEFYHDPKRHVKSVVSEFVTKNKKSGSSPKKTEALLTDEQKVEIRIGFDNYAKTKSGIKQVRIKDLGRLMRSLGQNPTEQEMIDMSNELGGKSPDGRFTFQEFLDVLLNKFLFYSDPTAEIHEVFSVFDRDGNGSIDMQEFRSILMRNNDITEAEVEEIFKEADINQDGMLDYHEFADMMTEELMQGDDDD